jgi:hypothetical protein
MKKMTKIVGISMSGQLAGGIALWACDDGGGNTSAPAKPEKHDSAPAHPLGAKDASKDVKVTGDMETPYDTIEIPVKITNHSSEASDYHIEATVYDSAGNQVDTAMTFVQRVQPGGTATSKLLGTQGHDADHYKITVIDRTAAVG